MNRRKIIGIIFIVAALLKLADMWGIIHLDWAHSWTEYFGPVLLLYIGIELLIYNFSHYPSQWLQRPLPLGEDGKRMHCSVNFGADGYIFRGEPFRGARLDAFCGGSGDVGGSQRPFEGIGGNEDFMGREAHLSRFFLTKIGIIFFLINFRELN